MGDGRWALRDEDRGRGSGGSARRAGAAQLLQIETDASAPALRQRGLGSGGGHTVSCVRCRRCCADFECMRRTALMPDTQRFRSSSSPATNSMSALEGAACTVPPSMLKVQIGF